MSTQTTGRLAQEPAKQCCPDQAGQFWVFVWQKARLHPPSTPACWNMSPLDQ